MKKALSILLIFCLMFTTVFSFPASAEETEGTAPSKKRVVLKSDFSSTTNWTKRNSSTVTYMDENGDGTNDYARFTSSKNTYSALRSEPFVIYPGDEYELTYYVRIPEESASFKVETTQYYPTYILYQPTLTEDGTKVNDNHVEGQNEYAYKKKRRTDFKSFWQIGDYEPYSRNNYSSFGSTHDYACKDENGNSVSPEEVYKDWTKVTLTFTGLDDEANDAVGAQITALYFSFSKNKVADGMMYDIKDLTLINKSVRENEEAIVFSDFSDFSDTSKWKVNTASAVHRVKYKDEDGDGVADYVNVNSKDNKHSYVTSLPTTLVPGTEYELSYYIRVPNTSADYVSGETKTYPKISIYQPTIDETTGLISTDYDGYVEGQTEYAYKKLRRANFESYWQIGDYEPYKRANYSIFSELHYSACNDVSPNEVYKNWTKVTATFTAIDDEANGAVGPQVVAFRIGVPSTLANVELDIKDLVLIDKSKISTEPEEPEAADAVYYEGFESLPNPTDIVTVYSGANVNPDWTKPAIVEGDAATGSKAYSVYAMYQDLFIPFDKTKLQADTVYSFSMDWMLKEYTADKKRRIDNVYIVGYTPTDGVTFAKGHEALGGKGEIQGTGKWENVSFNFKISENKFNEYEQFGVYIAYRTSGTNTETEDKIYLDTITLKVSENQDIINKIELNEAPRTENTIKVLAFGNSFSNDGTSFIPQIAYADGVDLRVADCSIGGCSLAKHYDKSITNDPAYSFYYRTPHQQNTHTKSYGNITMEQALTASDWDYITIQQVSTLSGKPDSFEPYLGKLIEKFKEYCPNAKIVFQMTWAYRDELVKSGYEYYNNDQETMYNAIIDTYLEYAEKYDVEFIIPSGETIQTLRGLKSDTLFTTEFEATEEEIAAGVNADKGDFTRDGFHLSDKGRVAAAFTWYEIFTGISALDTKIDLTTSAYGTLSNNKGTLIGITAEEALAIKTAAHNAASTYKKAVETTKAIKAIGTVDKNSGEAIEKAKALRAELNNDKLIVNLQTLLDAIAAFDALLPDDVVGDLDGDGAVKLEDVTKLAQALAGWNEVDESVLDFNNDDVVNLKDLIVLARFVAGWEGVTLG